MQQIGIFAFLGIMSACSENQKSLEDQEGVVQALDSDGDGFLSTDDCNDLDASINPAAEELCDSLDNNCDGQIDEDELLCIIWMLITMGLRSRYQRRVVRREIVL